MKKTLRAALSLSILAACPGIAPYQAAAQVVAVPVRAVVPGVTAGAAGAALRAPVFAPSLTRPLSFSPTLTSAPAPILPSVSAKARPAVAAAATAVAVQALAARAQAAPLAAALGETVAAVAQERPGSDAARVAVGTIFDGGSARLGETADVAGGYAASRPGLAPAARSVPSRNGVDAPQAPRGHGASRIAFAAIGVLAGAGLILAAPLALPAAGSAASVLAFIHPLSSVVAAVAGAVYGLIAAHRRGEEAPSAGEVLGSVLRYGVVSGAATFVLMELGTALFMGFPAAGLTPLPAAIATAALGQGAFQGKFAKPNTSAADRLMAAFPAIAGALGLSVGVALAAPGLLLTAAVSAMSLTGVAAAVYAAVYQPGKSAADGPASMARGYVLQTLMSGLALAVSGPYMAAPFLLLAAWGLWDVLATTYQAVGAALASAFRKN